MRFPVTLLTRT